MIYLSTNTTLHMYIHHKRHKSVVYICAVIAWERIQLNTGQATRDEEQMRQLCGLMSPSLWKVSCQHLSLG